MTVGPSKTGRGEVGETKNTGKFKKTGVSPLGATCLFTLLSFCLGLSCKIEFHPVISLVNPDDTSGHWTLLARLQWLNWALMRPPWLVVKALGTGAIPGDLSGILWSSFWMVREDGAAPSSDKLLGWGVHSFQAQLTSGVNHIPGL